jgi:hypothetical protein
LELGISDAAEADIMRPVKGPMNSGWSIAIFLCLSLAAVLGVLFATRHNIAGPSPFESSRLYADNDRVLVSLLLIAFFILGAFLMFLLLHIV